MKSTSDTARLPRSTPRFWLEARTDSLFSFPVELFHPLQHAGLFRCTPGSPTTQEPSRFASI
jgi:hypothetical protein